MTTAHTNKHSGDNGALSRNISSRRLSASHRSPSSVYPFVKRALDLTSSVPILLICIVPMLLIALMIRLDSRGPAIFKQIRTGKNGVEFTCYKFRTMATSHRPETHRQYLEHLITRGDVVATHMGAREITRVGQLLRKTSLDELPQLLNVVQGAMSMVGPRPPIPYEVAVYQTWHLRRLEVKPGLTGWWQVKGRARVTFDEMVRMDIEYIDHRSTWLDLKILAMTPIAAVRGSG